MPPGDTRQPAFDAAEHHRQRTRRAEARADALEQINQQLYRMLADAIVLIGGDPLLNLRLLDEMDRMRRARPSVDELVQLLRETDPERIGRAA